VGWDEETLSNVESVLHREFNSRSFAWEVRPNVFFQPEAPVLKLRERVNCLFGQRPFLTVAWGNAPGNQPLSEDFWPKAIFTTGIEVGFQPTKGVRF
jgi:hypothetical protein